MVVYSTTQFNFPNFLKPHHEKGIAIAITLFDFVIRL